MEELKRLWRAIGLVERSREEQELEAALAALLYETFEQSYAAQAKAIIRMLRERGYLR